MSKIYALFNRETKQFATWLLSLDAFPPEVVKTLLIREVVLEEYGVFNGVFDPERHRWIGDYEQGRFQDVLHDNVAIVTEKQLVQKYAEIFLRKYTLNDIWEVIKTAEMTTPEGLEMKQFLLKILKRMEDDMEFYKTSGVHDYITTEESKEKQEKAFTVT